MGRKTDGYIITEYSNIALVQPMDSDVRKKLMNDLVLYGKCISQLKDGYRIHVPYEEWGNLVLRKSK